MFEHRSQPLISHRAFLGRLLWGAGAGAGLVVISLAAGMIGYKLLEGLHWIDAFLNASMLLGGMGPVNTPVTVAGKLFAGFYALYCGLVVIVVAGFILAPVAHRLLHKFHLEKS
jgi:hypothetical protein